MVYDYYEYVSDICPEEVAVDMIPEKACVINTTIDDCERMCSYNRWPKHCRTNLECKFFQMKLPEPLPERLPDNAIFTCLLSTINCEPLDLEESGLNKPRNEMFLGVYFKTEMNLSPETLDYIWGQLYNGQFAKESSKLYKNC